VIRGDLTSRTVWQQPRLRIASWGVWIMGTTVIWLGSLRSLFVHAAQSELHSYIPLVPLVSGYLLYLQRKNLPADYRSSIGQTLILCVIGAAALSAEIKMRASLSENDTLTLQTIAYLSFVVAGGFVLLGNQWIKAAAFPIAFLGFMIPLPDAFVHRIETVSVLGSAEVSALFFRLAGTPLLRDGNVFVLPGIVLEIAQECSGIHSSWVLFITSLVASRMFLGSPWRQFILVTFVFPLAIIRNSFRILIIGLLCIHISPEMIHSYIHRQGGPIFFALSLIPLFGLLLWLRLREQSPA
jgi:exosortase C (VPDSG-CTERM-specific)